MPFLKPSFFGLRGRGAWSLLMALLALGLGALWSTGFAPLSYKFIAFPALCGGVLLMARPEKWRSAALSGFLFAFGAFAPGLSWTLRSMHTFGRLPLPVAVLGLMALAAICALFWGLAAGFAARFWRPGLARLFALSGFLTLAEWLRGDGGVDFGWLPPALATLDTPLAAIAPLGGGHLVNLVLFLGVAAVVGFALSPGRKAQIAALVSGCVVVSVVTVGTMTTWSTPETPLTVRLVQGDLPVVDGWTRASAAQRLQEVATLMQKPWPETAEKHRLVLTPEGIVTSDILRLPRSAQSALETFIDAAQAPVLLSAFRRDEADGWRNAAFFVREGEVALTDKRKLVPFGEYVPAGFRWFVDAMRIPLADQTPGPMGQENPLVAPNVHAGVLICYENLDGEVARSFWQAAKSAPNLLLVTSNLGWFGETIKAQHLDMTRFLALTTARPAASVSMNGLSAIVDASGHVIAEAPANGKAVLDVNLISTSGAPTPFVRFGDLPAVLLAVLLVCGVARVTLGSRKKRR